MASPYPSGPPGYSTPAEVVAALGSASTPVNIPSGYQLTNVKVVTTGYQIIDTDQVLAVDASAGIVGLLLPDPATSWCGQVIGLRPGPYFIGFTPFGSEAINNLSGGTTMTMPAMGCASIFTPDATNWRIRNSGGVFEYRKAWNASEFTSAGTSKQLNWGTPLPTYAVFDSFEVSATQMSGGAPLTVVGAQIGTTTHPAGIYNGQTGGAGAYNLSGGVAAGIIIGRGYDAGDQTMPSFSISGQPCVTLVTTGANTSAAIGTLTTILRFTLANL